MDAGVALTRLENAPAGVGPPAKRSGEGGRARTRTVASRVVTWFWLLLVCISWGHAHAAKQQEERDKRSRAALERSQAPVKKRVGKPVMKRTAPADFGRKKKDDTEEKDVDEEAEFFQ